MLRHSEKAAGPAWAASGQIGVADSWEKWGREEDGLNYGERVNGSGSELGEPVCPGCGMKQKSVGPCLKGVMPEGLGTEVVWLELGKWKQLWRRSSGRGWEQP